jgi:2,5-dihydroxypyridine 5,6-dioxygenase
MQGIQFAIRSIFKDCLQIRPKEHLLILSDEPLKEIGLSLYYESLHFCTESHLLIIPEVTRAYEEPGTSVGAHMAQANCVVLATSKSLSHTRARRKACRNGTRIVSLPGISKESLIRTMTGNYRELITTSLKIADIFTIGKSAHLTSNKGTDLSFSLSRVRGHADTGIVNESGRFSNLPAGEGCAGPAAGLTNGILVIDGSFPGIGKLKNPVKMRVKDGYVIRITGLEEAEKIRKLLRPYGRAGKMIAEIGVGTNPNASFSGFTLEDEKVRGSVHIALGNNVSFDGKNEVPCHFDGILLKPTLKIDGITIVADGVLQV